MRMQSQPPLHALGPLARLAEVRGNARCALLFGGKARYMVSFHSRVQQSESATACESDFAVVDAASRSFLLANAWRDRSAGTAEGNARMSLTMLQLLELLPLEKGFSRTKWHQDGGACDRKEAAADGGESDHTGFITHACNGSIADAGLALFANVKHQVSL